MNADLMLRVQYKDLYGREIDFSGEPALREFIRESNAGNGFVCSATIQNFGDILLFVYFDSLFDDDFEITKH